MNIRFYFQQINKIDKEELEKYLDEEKLNRLTCLLNHGSLALTKFVLNAKYHKHHNIFVVRLGLGFAKNNFETEELSQDLIKAFDLAFDRLISQLRKLESLKHK